MIPQVMPAETETLAALYASTSSYLYSALARSRWRAKARAAYPPCSLIDQLQLKFNQARQNSIDEELFDVITGYEALSQA
jgi:F-type H+-transporting ATPase subunit gamma